MFKRVALYFQSMSNSIDFNKGISLRVIPVHIIVSAFDASHEYLSLTASQTAENLKYPQLPFLRNK